MIFPDKLLAKRFEQALAQDTRAYVESVNQLFPQMKATYESIGGGYAIFTGLPYINSAIGMGLDNPLSSEDMDQLQAFFTTHQIAPQVEICPYTDVEFLTLLNDRNYRLSKFYSAYARLLDDKSPETPSAIIVEPVDQEDSGVWVQAVMDIAPDDPQSDTRLAKAAFHREHVVCFVAWIDGEPVGACALSIHDGLAILHFTATRHAYRGRGAQTAMLQARLAYAQAQGCELALTTSIPGNNSMRNIIRAGFQTIYTRCILQMKID